MSAYLKFDDQAWESAWESACPRRAVLAPDEKRRYHHNRLTLSDEQSTEPGFLPARRFTSRNAGAALRELKASCRHDDQSRDSCPDEAERFHRESQSLVSWAQKNPSCICGYNLMPGLHSFATVSWRESVCPRRSLAKVCSVKCALSEAKL